MGSTGKLFPVGINNKVILAWFPQIDYRKHTTNFPMRMKCRSLKKEKPGLAKLKERTLGKYVHLICLSQKTFVGKEWRLANI